MEEKRFNRFPGTLREGGVEPDLPQLTTVTATISPTIASNEKAAAVLPDIVTNVECDNVKSVVETTNTLVEEKIDDFTTKVETITEKVANVELEDTAASDAAASAAGDLYAAEDAPVADVASTTVPSVTVSSEANDVINHIDRSSSPSTSQTVQG